MWGREGGVIHSARLFDLRLLLGMEDVMKEIVSNPIKICFIALQMTGIMSKNKQFLCHSLCETFLAVDVYVEAFANVNNVVHRVILKAAVALVID